MTRFPAFHTCICITWSWWMNGRRVAVTSSITYVGRFVALPDSTATEMPTPDAYMKSVLNAHEIFCGQCCVANQVKIHACRCRQWHTGSYVYLWKLRGWVSHVPKADHGFVGRRKHCIISLTWGDSAYLHVCRQFAAYFHHGLLWLGTSRQSPLTMDGCYALRDSTAASSQHQ